MKLNVYQKIVLIIYGCLFVYFSIIHVPFKSNFRNEIKYDTIFSTSSNLDVSRLVLIIVILSILTVILFLLFRNLSYSIKFQKLQKRTTKIILYSVLVLAIILAIVFGISKYQPTKENIVRMPAIDSTSALLDSAISKGSKNTYGSERGLKKAENCTSKNALENFQSYMKFYYPDWKIYGKPVVREQSDCTFEIQFTTMNPHFRYEKEVMIVEISFDYDFSHYYFRKVRGTLY